MLAQTNTKTYACDIIGDLFQWYNLSIPQQVPLPFKISRLTSSYDIIFALTFEGDVYYHKTNYSRNPWLLLHTPESIVKIKAKYQKLCLLGTSGTVYYSDLSDGNAYGTTDTIRKLQLSPPIPQIIDIAVGRVFMALDDNGVLYEWIDDNDYHIVENIYGSEHTFIPNIPLIIVLHEPIVKMDNDNNNTFVLGRSGKLYSWGDNLFGQLGTGVDVDVRKSNPITEVPLPIIENIIDICCQEMFTIILSESGHVYGCGYNYGGELGSTDETYINFLNLIPFPEPIISIYSTNENTFAIAANSGNIYGYGGDNHTQLPTSNLNKTTPILIFNIKIREPPMKSARKFKY